GESRRGRRAPRGCSPSNARQKGAYPRGFGFSIPGFDAPSFRAPTLATVPRSVSKPTRCLPISFSRGVEFSLFMIQAPLVPESRVRIYGVIVHRLCRGQIAAPHPAPGTGMIVFITTPDHHTTFKALVAGEFDYPLPVI